MTIRVFNGSNWNNIAQRINVFRAGIGWTRASKLSVWRGNDSTGFWSTVYPDLPVAIGSATVTGTGFVGTQFNISNLLVWDFLSSYRAPESYTYQWQRSASTSGPWSNVGSLLTSYSAYTIQASDVGYYFRLAYSATNARGTSVYYTPASPVFVVDPSYSFEFNTSFGLNANGYIMLDPTSGGSFPNNGASLLIANRVLAFFMGDWKIFDIWYRSSTTQLKIFHRLYRADQTRPSAPSIVIEIVFTVGSQIAEIFIVDPVSTSYILSYTAYQDTTSTGFPTAIQTYNSSEYAAGYKFSVPMNAIGSITRTLQSADATPTVSGGWIYHGSFNDSDVATVVFSPGSGLLSNWLNTSTFNKPNMFYPTTPTINAPTNITSTSATFSWSGSNAQSYIVKANRVSDSVQTFIGNTTSTSITVSSFAEDVQYYVYVTPISRSTYDGQEGITALYTYTHDFVQAPPPTVDTVTVNNIKQTEVDVNWTSTNQSDYQVRVLLNGVSQYTSGRVSNAATRKVTATGLSADTSYTAEVTVWNSGNVSASRTSTFTTETNDPVIDSFTVDSIQQTQARATWTSTRQAAYRVRVWVGTNTGVTPIFNTLKTSSTSTTSVTITGISPDTSYTAELTIWNAGDESVSTTTTFTSATNDPVINSLTVNNVTRTSFTVNWTSTRQAEYRVRVYLGSGTGGTVVSNTLRVANSSTRSVSVSGLVRNTLYTIELTIWNSAEETVSSTTTQRTLN